MAWDKGAVVIIKRGDKEMSDAMEKGLNINESSQRSVEELEKEIEELKKENKELRRSNEMMKIHDTRFANEAIESMSNRYVYHYRTPPKILKFLIDVVVLIVYWISLFVDKYLVIK